MTTPFATADDLQARWPSLTDAQKPWADILLGDAAMWLRIWFPGIDDRIAAGALDPNAPLVVSCAMVKRAILAASNEGQSNSTETMGPFSHTVTYKNPDGNLYLTAQEEELLSGSTSGAVSMECEGF